MVSKHRALKRLCARHVQRLKRLIKLSQQAWRLYSEYDDRDLWLPAEKYHYISGLCSALRKFCDALEIKAESTLQRLDVRAITEKLFILDINDSAQIWLENLPELLTPYQNEHLGCEICQRPTHTQLQLSKKRPHGQSKSPANDLKITATTDRGTLNIGQELQPTRDQPVFVPTKPSTLGRSKFIHLASQPFRKCIKATIAPALGCINDTEADPEPTTTFPRVTFLRPMFSCPARWVFHRWKIKCYENDAELGKLFGIRGQSWIGTVLLLC